MYSGPDASVGDALATCTDVAIGAVYWLEPHAQAWRRYFPGRPEVSSLTTLSDLQGVMILGLSGGHSVPLTEAALPMVEGPGRLENCPPPGKWAISVWDGESRSPIEQALSTCAEVAVGAVYWLDPQTQAWRRYFPGRQEISDLMTLANMQGVIALGVAQEGGAAP